MTRRHDRRPSKRSLRPIILIVEDHQRLRAELRNWLTSTFPGCALLDVGSGEEAIQLAQARRPDVVLMDVLLPGMSGIEATSHLKAVVPQTKVVILSFREGVDDQAAAQRAGAISYIHKCEITNSLAPLLAPLLNYPIAE